MSRRTTRQVTRSCPYCGDVHDCATDATGGDAKPSPGAISVCINCGELSTFTDELRLRPMTPGEVSSLGMSDEADIAFRAQRLIRAHGRRRP